MASRYRPPSPVGRRYAQPERASTSSFYKSDSMPTTSGSRRHRESFTSPRTSAERVIPISSETYVNGAPVGGNRSRYDTYDDRRRSTLDAYDVPRASVSSSTPSSSLRPAVVHNDRGVSPLPRSSRYDGDYYVTPATSGSRREHKKVYSVDDGRSARLVGANERSGTKRAELEPPPRISERGDYRMTGGAERRDRRTDVDDYDSYEYTDPRGMYRDTEPKSRTRRGSVDAASRRDRTSSLIEPYSTKNGSRDYGPPPTTRGLDRINSVSRHDSLSGMGGQRARDRNYGSNYSEDDNYRVAPRTSTRRPESMYVDKRDAFSPTRESYEERPDPRRMSRRFEDTDVANRGFGVRAPSIDDHDRRSESIDSRARRADSIVAPGRREHGTERTTRDETRADPDRREPKRPAKYEEPQFIREEPERENDRNLARERDPPREKERDYEDDRRPRDRERLRAERDRDYERHSDDDRRPREKRLDRDIEPDRRDRYEEKKREDSDHGSYLPGAAAGTAAAGALAYGANEALHRRDRERKDEPRDEVDEKPHEERLKDERVKENRNREDPVVEERARAPVKSDVVDPIREDVSPDAERIRARNYIGKDDAQAKQVREIKSEVPEGLDPEEDYRRRVAQELERVKGVREDEPSDPDRERRRRDRERRHHDAYEAPRDSVAEPVDESRALMPIEPNRENSLDNSVSDGIAGSSDASREKRVAIVEPPKEKERPKSILRKPTQKFPEDPNPIREGVAPLKDAKNKNIPNGARWTKIDRRLVNPEALEEAQERFEERKDCVIVLRVLTKDDIQKFAEKTKEIRAIDETFPGLPPFPTDVPTAPLLRLSLRKLLDDDQDENQRLWEACTELGFFYLDIASAATSAPTLTNGHANGHAHTNGHASNGHPAHDKPPLDGGESTHGAQTDYTTYLTTATSLFTASTSFFSLPDAEKQTYDFKHRGSYFGYKGLGFAVTDAKGTRDRNEFYNIAKDHILRLPEPTEPPLPMPEEMTRHQALLERFIRDSHGIVALVLEKLGERLGLPRGTLEDLHRLDRRSGDQVRFVRSPPQLMEEEERRAALGAHTDFGSVTVLFNQLGGLQVLPPPPPKGESGDSATQAGGDGGGGWLYVKPLPGHAIINLGDAMVKLTGGVLRSNMHRVVNPPGDEQGKMVRTSLVYFARPRDEVVLKKLQGSKVVDEWVGRGNGVEEGEEEVTAREWTLRRALGRRSLDSWIKSGGTEHMRQT
ncbi:MAG: hypothetical protein M1828_000247 [Chrysothrix sp. TS-e1954]|nr:MAG: hypothetical protein M1828_000247 [Chrysothrix sp. TS-e1954]